MSYIRREKNRQREQKPKQALNPPGVLRKEKLFTQAIKVKPYDVIGAVILPAIFVSTEAVLQML